MASQVTVIGTDLRQAKFTVQPNTRMTEVLEKYCEQFGLSSGKYLLRHNKKKVDLSLPYRTTGLPPGAKLELVVKSSTPTVVSVALQIPQPDAKEIPGGRLTSKFSSDTTIWKLLRQFESGPPSAGRNLNITARGVAQTNSGAQTGSGQLYYETPVLNIMGRELSSFTDFQRTLSQLGYSSGSVLIRLNYRTTDKTFFDATTEISDYFKDEEISEAATAGGNSPSKEAVPESEEKQDAPPTTNDAPVKKEPATATPPVAPQDQEPQKVCAEDKDTEMTDAPVTTGFTDPTDPLKPVSVFSAPTGATPAAALTSDSDEAFELSVAQAQTYQATLEKRSRNQRLPSDKELAEIEAAKKAKVEAVKSVLMRVRFPDGTLAEWSFGPDASGATLYRAVRSVMADPALGFRLLLPAEKVEIADKESPRTSLIRGYRLQGKVLVTVLWSDSVSNDARNQAFLRDSVAKHAVAVPVPGPPAAQEETAAPQRLKPTKPSQGNKDTGDLAKKAAKWLKLGKK